MKLNTKTLAQKVADRVSDRFEEELMDAIQEITADVLEENGVDLDDNDAWETMMEVAERIAVVAV